MNKFNNDKKSTMGKNSEQTQNINKDDKMGNPAQGVDPKAPMTKDAKDANKNETIKNPNLRK